MAQAKKNTNTNATTKKISAKEKLTAFILDAIEVDGALPWDNALLNTLAPINASTMKRYRGGNILALSMMGNKLPAAEQEWVTFNQVTKLGGKVKKGEHGTPIIFYTPWDKERKCIKDDKSKEEDVIFIIKGSTVFDISQCEGITPKRDVTSIQHDRYDDAEKVIADFAKATNLKLNLTKKGGVGWYSPTSHEISVAGIAYYKTAEEYYSTLFHEMTHSTAIALDRNIDGVKGGTAYSKEEVIAECGAMLLCMEFGISKHCRDNSAAYLKEWSAHLKDNPDWLISGMSAAEKAVKYVFDKAGYKPQIVC